MGIRSERGQATVEHLGIVAIVALVIVAASAISAVAAPGLLNRVTGNFQRALCVVTGQTCEHLAREPCPVRRQTDRSSQGAAVGWLRLGHDRVLFIERRSDGSYLLSLVEGGRAGAGLGRDVGGAGTADASLTLGWKGGRQYVVATPEEARALVRRLRADPLPALSTQAAAALDLTGLRDADPSVDAYVLSGDGTADAVARLGFGGIVEAGAELSTSNEVGVKIAAHRREVTVYARADAKLGGFYDAFTRATMRRRARPSPAPVSSGRTRPDLTKRPAGATTPAVPSSTPGGGAELSAQTPTKPLEGAVSGSLALRFGPGPKLLGVEVVLSAATSATQRELRIRLDPSEPAVDAALGRWRAAPADLDAVQALASAAADSSAIDDRTFGLADHKGTGGVQALADAVPGLRELGLSFTTERGIGVLVEQRSKPTGGVWETRLDCQPAAIG